MHNKPDQKSISVVNNKPQLALPSRVQARMYRNNAGASFSHSVVCQQLEHRMGTMFGKFTVYEGPTGELLVNTGMSRDMQFDKLIMTRESATCSQPCKGNCEDGACAVGCGCNGECSCSA